MAKVPHVSNNNTQGARLLYISYINLLRAAGGGGVVQWLRLPALKVRDRGFESHSLRDREVTCSVSDCQGSNFESCVWRAVSSHSSHHPQKVLLAQFSLYVNKGGLKPHSFHFLQISYLWDHSIIWLWRLDNHMSHRPTCVLTFLVARHIRQIIV